MRDVDSYYQPENGYKPYAPVTEYLAGGGRGQPGKPESAASPSPAANSGPKPGAVEDGYRFKGGDPGKQENWEPVQ
jgi:hypothetical protein